jgi:molecular chaperone DnaJ
VRIPVGAEEGMVLRVPGKGRAASEPRGRSGDLLVVLVTRPDPRFERRGADLWRREAVEAPDAVLGTTLRMPTLERPARLKVPAGTQPDTVFRLAGKGLPRFGGGDRGDLYVALEVRIPERPSREERELWEGLRARGREREPRP